MLVACNSNSNTKANIDHFASQAKATQSYVKKEDVRGSVDLITTTKGDKLLVTQLSGDNYCIGELGKDDKGYYAEKVSQTFLIVSGEGWEFNTIGGNKYTIFFNKSKKNSDFNFLTNQQFCVSILEGNTLSNTNVPIKNAIKSIKNVKK